MALQKIGALWKKKAKQSGMGYLSGSIEVIAGQKIFITILPYTTKEGVSRTPNSPDYNVLIQVEDKVVKSDVKEENEKDLVI